MNENQHVFHFRQKVRAATQLTGAQHGPVHVSCTADRSRGIAFCNVGDQTIAQEFELPEPWSKPLRVYLETIFSSEESQ